MKKLLSLLATTILTAPVSMGLVACGNDEDAEATENFNVEELLAKAEKEIKLGFSDFCKKKEKTDKVSNDLMNENMYETHNKDIINSELKRLEVQNPQQNQQIESGVIKDQFLSQIQGDINDIIVKRLQNKNELKPLFRNINPTEILKIKDKPTRLVKLVFNWQNEVNDYGIGTYDHTRFHIDWWYRIRAELKLDLSYNNHENQQVKKDISHDYIFSYSNGTANINELINLATENIEKQLENYILQLPVTIFDDEDQKNRLKFIQKLQAKILDSNVEFKDIEILSLKKLEGTNTTSDDIYKTGNVLHEALTKSSSDGTVQYLRNNYLQPIVNKFRESLGTFIANYKNFAGFNSVEIDKINDYGRVTITNWNIKSLTLRTIDIPFIKSRTDQTQEQWAENVSSLIGQMFHSQSFLKDYFNMLKNGDLTVTMNPEDFETAVNNQKMWDIRQYFSDKINLKAMNIYNNLVKKPIFVSMTGYWSKTPNPILGDPKFFNSLDNGNTYVLSLKDKRHNPPLHGWNYVHINYDNVNFFYGGIKDSKGRYLIFNNTIIKKGITDFWPK